MFTGIVEELATITKIDEDKNNKTFTFKSTITNELSIDQSVAHNGVCLTVVAIMNDEYEVTVVQETLNKTTLANWTVGDAINIERGISLNSLLDGHIVQGHVDTTLQCTAVKDEGGSTRFTFQYPKNWGSYLIPKGSVCINGVSLTIANLTDDCFSVAIIPYTLNHTTFKNLQQGEQVNIEFDVIGKYINRIANYQA